MARTGTPNLLPILRSERQAAIMQEMLLGDDGERSVSDLVDKLDIHPAVVRSELERLRHVSLVSARRVGRTSLYVAARDSPLYEPMRQLLERSVGVEPRLKQALEGLHGLEAAILYGSWARAELKPSSDIDVLVIGEVDYAELVRRICDVQRASGRDVNVLSMTRNEFRDRLARGSGFVASIVASPKRSLIGDLEIE